MGLFSTLHSIFVTKLRSSIALVIALLAASFLSSFSMAQVLEFRDGGGGGEDIGLYGDEVTEFVWTRGNYLNYGGGRSGGFGFGRRSWADTDYPDSEQNFLRGVQRYTNVDTNPANYIFIDLTDPRLFENVFLYMNWKRVPIGTSHSGPNFTPEEIEAIREFTARGGFVLVDDFWGQPHLDDMFVEIQKIYPDREIVQLDTSHEIFHTFFDIDELAQVPGRMVTWDLNGYFNLDDPSYPPEVYAVLDDNGRVMMVANYNTDLGDGWEHTFYQPYPTKYTNEAYKVGINFLIYALSH